jgi:hypothetical protein
MDTFKISGTGDFIGKTRGGAKRLICAPINTERFLLG